MSTPYEEGKAAGLAGESRSSCTHQNGSMDHSFWMAGWDSGDRDRRSIERQLRDDQAADVGKARNARVRAVAKGATINGTYRLPPGEALDAFRADLLRIVGE